MDAERLGIKLGVGSLNPRCCCSADLGCGQGSLGCLAGACWRGLRGQGQGETYYWETSA